MIVFVDVDGLIAVKGGEIVRTPGLKFPNGFHINLIDRE